MRGILSNAERKVSFSLSMRRIRYYALPLRRYSRLLEAPLFLFPDIPALRRSQAGAQGTPRKQIGDLLPSPLFAICIFLYPFLFLPSTFPLSLVSLPQGEKNLHP